VNDVALATVAGAVREFLISRRVHPGEIGFRVAVPVSVRRKEEHGQLGNRGSSWLVELPVGEADPRQRLAVVKNTTHDLKLSQQALGVEMMMAVAEWTPTVLLSLGMRAASGAANMVVTNVPGPRMPLYFLGAKVLAFYPVVPLIEHTGLAVGLISYADTMCWGFNADDALLPDLGNFVEMINASFNELSRAAGVGISGARPETARREVAERRSGRSSPHGKRQGARSFALRENP
jgi:WS/DGAT/MGAT family acyltransferase